MKLYKKEVGGCFECPGRTSIMGEFCNQTIEGRGIKNIYKIPDWCPLPDASQPGVQADAEKNHCDKCGANFEGDWICPICHNRTA